MDMSLLSHASSLKVSRVRLLTIVAFIGWSVPSVAFHSFCNSYIIKVCCKFCGFIPFIEYEVEVAIGHYSACVADRIIVR